MPTFRALASVAAAALAVATATPVRAQSAGPFDIPRQDARTALVTLCLRAGCAVSFVSEPGPAYRSNAVHGARDWQTAMARMLEGTGLRYRLIDGRSARVWVEARPPRPARSPPPSNRPTWTPSSSSAASPRASTPP